MPTAKTFHVIQWLALSLVGFSLTAFAEDSSALLDKQTQAYITVVYADDAMERGRVEEAKKQYADALNLYREIAETDPSWNADMIHFRIANCINALENIQQRQQRIAPARSPQADSSANYYEARYQSAVKENDYLRSRISKLELELEDTEDDGDLRAQIADLRRQNAQLKTGQETVEDAFADDLRKTRENAEQLRVQLDTQKKEMARLLLIRDRYDRVLEQLQVSQTQRKTLESQAGELRESLRRQSTLVDQLESALEKNKREATSPDIIQSLEKQVNNEKSINRQLVSQLDKADKKALDLEQRVEEQKARVSDFSQQISTLLGRENERVETIAGLREKLVSLSEKNEALEAAIAAARQEAAAPSAELKQALQEQERLTQTLTEASRQRDLGLETINMLQEEIRALTVRNASIQQELEAIKQHATAPEDSAEVQDLYKTIQDLESEREGLKQALQHAAEDLRTWKAESKSTSDEATENMVPKAEYDILQGEMIDLRYEVTKLQHALAKSSNGPALELAYEEAVEDLKTLRAEHSRLQQQFSAQRIEKSRSTPNPSPMSKRKPAPDTEDTHLEEAPREEEEPHDPIPAAADALSRGIDAEQQGQLDTALHAYQDVLTDAPENLAALKGEIRILLQQQNPRDCLPLLERAEKIDGKDLEVFLLEGMTWYQLENYRRAGSILRKLVRKDPANARAHNALGAVYMAEKDYFRSRDSFNNAVIHDASLSDAHFNLAQVVRLSDPDNRIFIREHYEIALSLGAAPDPAMEAFLKE